MNLTRKHGTYTCRDSKLAADLVRLTKEDGEWSYWVMEDEWEVKRGPLDCVMVWVDDSIMFFVVDENTVVFDSLNLIRKMDAPYMKRFQTFIKNLLASGIINKVGRDQ